MYIFEKVPCHRSFLTLTLRFPDDPEAMTQFDDEPTTDHPPVDLAPPQTDLSLYEQPRDMMGDSDQEEELSGGEEMTEDEESEGENEMVVLDPDHVSHCLFYYRSSFSGRRGCQINMCVMLTWIWY